MAQTTLDAKVKIGSVDIELDEVHDLLVDCDLDTPDMAAVTLSNQSTQWSSKTKVGDTLEIKAGLTNGNEPNYVFKGEVTGIEPSFISGGAARVVVRGLNRLHRLARGKESKTYAKMSDADIIKKICGDNNLTPKVSGSVNTKYDHIYQHNQTNLEFIRLRAARIGYEIFVDDKDLHFRKRDLSKDSGITLDFGVSGTTVLEKFLPRLSTANQVTEVEVRGWDPHKKESIVGKATSAATKLGDKDGSAAAKDPFGKKLYFDVDVPIFEKEQADNLAKSILEDKLMSYITGEGTAKGIPNLKPGVVITVNVGCERFNGKYYVTAVRHRYLHEGPDHGFRTHFRVRRNAAK
jgi:uncharacterized protein